MQKLKPKRRGGFTFLEVLFAVMILGIGMIMVAAMFPAGIKQTQANVEDTAFMALGRGMARTMQQMGGDTLLNPQTVSGVKYNHSLDYYLRPADMAAPGAPRVYSFNDPRGALPNQAALWNYVRGNMVLTADPSYGFALLFSRDKMDVTGLALNENVQRFQDQPAVTLYIIPVKARNKTQFTVATDTSFKPSALDPVLVQVNVVLKNSPSDCRVTVTQLQDGAGTQPINNVNAGQFNPVEDGSYLIFSDMNNTAFNGSIYRVGARLPPGKDPILGSTIPAGNDRIFAFSADRANGAVPTGTTTTALSGLAFVVGRGPTSAVTSNKHQPRSGPTQELGVAQTVISLTLK
jgi:type II secretory pathway pseudopilin PulG